MSKNNFPLQLLLFLIVVTTTFNKLFSKSADKDSLFNSLTINSKLTDKEAIASFYLLLQEKEEKLSIEQQIALSKKGLAASEKLYFDSLSHLFIQQLSLEYFTLGDISKELAYRKKELKYALLINDLSSIIDCQFNIGSIYLDQGKYSKGIDYLLEVTEKVSNSNNQEVEKFKYYSYVNLGNLAFLSLEEHEESIKYLKRAEPYFIKTKEYDFLTKIYLGLASNFQKLENLDSVQYYIDKTAQLVDEKIDESRYSEDDYLFENFKYDYASILDHYLDINELDSAKIYREKLKKWDFSDLPYQYVLDLQYYLLQNDLEKVKSLLADPASKELAIQEQVDFLNTKAKYFEKIGDYQQSLLATQKLKEAEIKNLSKNRVKWSDFTDGQIKGIELEKNVEELQLETTYQKQLRYFSYALALLFLLLMLSSLFAYKQVQQNLKDTKLLEQQTRKLQIAEQEKNKLFINIAHELQTPLSIISGLSKQLGQSERLNSSEIDQLKMISNNSRTLSDTTHQLLELSKANTKTLSVVSNYFYLEELIQYLLSEFQFIAATKQIEIKYNLPQKNKCLIYSDIDKLSVVFKNIIANAIRYTGNSGTINIAISVTEGTKYQVVIKDTGVGIAEADIPYLFDRYFQSTSSQIKGGIGIGLAISRDYINQLSGKIEVQSILEVGSEFLITLPQHTTSNKANSLPQNEAAIYHFPINIIPPKIPIDTSGNKDLKILIVEDNLDFCSYLSSLLTTLYQLTIVHSGQQAVQYLETSQPDLIITDWMMSNMDGIALVTYLKQKDQFKSIPVLMLTARTLLSDQLKAIRIGIDDYLTKPFEEIELKARIQYLLRQSVLEEEVTVEPTIQKVVHQLSPAEEKWLLELEQQVIPLIGNFDLNVESVAATMHLGQKQLTRKLKKITGLTPRKYIQELRFWEARRLLELKKLNSVKAVSFTIGYKDVKGFSRRFKERFGSNPSDLLKGKNI